MHGAYSVNPNMAKLLNNGDLTFLVLDDILTSGATTREITRALSYAYPKARIYIFTLLKTLYHSQDKPESAEAQQNSQLFRDLYSSESSLKLASEDERYSHPTPLTNLVNKKFFYVNLNFYLI